MNNKIFNFVIHKEKNIYVAECNEIGIVSQGYTIDEAINNLKEATELYIEEFPIVESKPVRQFDFGKGTFTFISDDFDEPLENFKEYMP